MKRSTPTSLVLLMSLLLAITTCNVTLALEEQPKLDVPYVPTPQPVVEKMLQMANVKEGDVVYDLGCGDGRIVITAAKDFGATGVGVDIDPKRIAESKQNAEKAGVTDKVKFLQQDLFTMDFSEADVLAIYLLPSVNVKLRPKILELEPGTRVVSHAFDMAEWEPDQTAEVEHRSIYYWVVPAKVKGSWTWEADTPQGKKPVSVTLEQDFQKVSGTAKIGDEQFQVTDAKLEGDKLSFTLKPADGSGEPVASALRYEGRVQGDEIKGMAYTGEQRDPGEAQPAAAQQQEQQQQKNGEKTQERPDPQGVEWTARRAQS